MTLSGNRPIVFVHGFLGLSGDWRPFAREGRDRSIDLWPVTAKLPAAADPFAAAAAEILKDLPAEKPIVVAYSMGARLAMHALIEAPGAFHSAVLISGHPGLAAAGDERPARLKADQAWAERFRREPWADLLAAWNGQAVLEPAPAPAHKEGALELRREASSFEREALARALDFWSLGRQRDLRGELKELGLPLLFVTGEKDTKFTALARGLGFAEHRELAACGHRVPWEQPLVFSRFFSEFQSRCRC